MASSSVIARSVVLVASGNPDRRGRLTQRTNPVLSFSILSLARVDSQLSSTITAAMTSLPVRDEENNTNLTSYLKSHFRENEKAATPALQDICRLPRCRRIRPFRLLRRVQISGGDVKFVLWSILLGSWYPLLRSETGSGRIYHGPRPRTRLSLCRQPNSISQSHPQIFGAFYVLEARFQRLRNACVDAASKEGELCTNRRGNSLHQYVLHFSFVLNFTKFNINFVFFVPESHGSVEKYPDFKVSIITLSHLVVHQG